MTGLLVSGFVTKGSGVESACDEVVVWEVLGRPSLEADIDGAWLISDENPLVEGSSATGCAIGAGIAAAAAGNAETPFGAGRV